MMRTISFKTAVALASVSVFAACTPAGAQDESAAAAVPDAAAAPAAKAFAPMMRCAEAEGLVEVLKPRTEAWERAEKGRFYPLGTSVRTGAADSSAEFVFGEKASIVVSGVAEYGTREVEFGAQERTVVLQRGRVSLKLPRTLGEGLFTVAAPAFCCRNLAGESVFDYAATGDGDEVVVRCVTGTMAVEGAHFAIPRMGAANQIRLRTTGDQLFTSLRGESGDCKVNLDMGLVRERNFDTGEMKDAPRTLEFALSPKCAIKIFRAKAGERMAVSVMTFGASGDMLNRFAFCEGRSNINSGELVISTKVADEKDAEKKADDEEEETVEAQPAKAGNGKKAKAEDEDEEEKAEEKDEEKDDKKDDEKDDKKDDSDDK